MNTVAATRSAPVPAKETTRSISFRHGHAHGQAHGLSLINFTFDPTPAIGPRLGGGIQLIRLDPCPCPSLCPCPRKPPRHATIRAISCTERSRRAGSFL